MNRGTSPDCWKDKMCLLTIIHSEEGNAKPLCIESYGKNMDFMDVSNMTNSYVIFCTTWKLTK